MKLLSRVISHWVMILWIWKTTSMVCRSISKPWRRSFQICMSLLASWLLTSLEERFVGSNGKNMVLFCLFRICLMSAFNSRTVSNSSLLRSTRKSSRSGAQSWKSLSRWNASWKSSRRWIWTLARWLKPSMIVKKISRTPSGFVSMDRRLLISIGELFWC